MIRSDPWQEGPPAALLQLMPLGFWREHRAVPLGNEDGALVVASEHTLPDAAVAAIRAATFRDVRAAVAANDEIEMWLEVVSGERTWEQALAGSLHALIRSVGLAALVEAELPPMPGHDTDLEVIASAFALSEDATVELIALRARLPQIRIARYPRPPYLAAVVDQDLARELRVVPVAVHTGIAVVATPRVHGPAARARLRRAIGAEVRIALCTPSAFEAAFRQVYGTAEKPSAAPTADEIYDRLIQSGSIEVQRREPLGQIASLSGETRLSAALRMGYVAPDDVASAAAALIGIHALDVASPVVELSLASCASPDLWRSRRCVPVAPNARSVTLATERRLNPAEIEVVRRIVGATEVTPRYLAPDALDTLLLDLPQPSPPDHRPEDHLLGAGLVLPERAASARKQAAREGLSFLRTLVARGLVGAEDVIEARAIVLGRPWVHVDRCSPDPSAVDAIDARTARDALALPLALRGGTLLVAFLALEVDESEVQRGAPVPIDAIDATAADIDAILARWYAPRSVVPSHYVQFGRALAGRGWLTRSQVDRALDELARGRPLDSVLTGRTLLRPEQLAIALGTHLDLPVADIEPREREVRTIDALGAERTEMVREDPVDPLVARRVGHDLAVRRGLIPVAVRGHAIEVAFVDPLDEEARRAVADALGTEVSATVATRREVEAAQRRVYARPSVGERLIEVGIITREQLERALELHDHSGVRVGAALVSLGLVSELELAAAIAEQAGLPFVDLRSAEADPEVAKLVAPLVARDRGVLPLFDDGRALVVACTEVLDAEEIREIPGIPKRPLSPVIVTEGALDRALNVLWRDEYVRIAATQLLSRSPGDSARWVLSRGQRVFFALLAVATIAGLLIAPIAVVTVYVAFSTVFYVSFSAYKFYLAYRAMGTSLEIEVTAEDLALLDDRDLPIYTILIPVYREAKVFPILAKAIERLDYPKSKLDVKVLLEEDDLETIDVARAARLPSYFDLLIVPAGGPKGKPKACNYGLIHAKGDQVVIFDAEDIPEPDQLKKAVVAFRKGDERLACVQAKLNYFNRDQNLLTRWFTTEYSMWFDLFLPGLDASGAPIPLGGTSNHFRTAQLRDLGAWDPYNVTEDADLGMRLYKQGWTTAVIDSTTFEEANAELYNWIRQRSRWVKGYIQTYLVHMRHPLRLYRQIGPKAFISFQFVVGGTFFGYLVNPLYWLLTATWFLFHWGLIREIFPAPVFYLGSIGLYLGNFAFTYLNVAGCLRREYYDMVKYALLSPIYWAFMSVAAWKGFLQLFYRPSYWEKTEHGLYRGVIRLKRTPVAPAA